MSFPKHRIPKINAMCLVCDDINSTILMSQPFADGYHRRHLCNSCGSYFYTLAKYDRSAYDRQASPFKDRPLTPEEIHERAEWEGEAEAVTIEGNGQVFATEFIEIINDIYTRHLRGEAISDKEADVIVIVEEANKAYHE